MAGWGIWRHARLTAAVLLGALVLLAATGAGLARADGDPASDYLLGNQVFLASQVSTLSPAQRELVATVAAANRAGFTLRVALVPSDYDLGSITELWLRPSLYARFLDLELGQIYRQRLLVVMPNGFGFAWPGHATAAASRLLAGLHVAPGDPTLSEAAQIAVRRLAAASGVTLPVAASSSPAGHRAKGAGASSAVELAFLAAALLALAAALAGAATRRHRRRPRRPRRALRVPAVPSGWLIPGLIGVLALAIGVPIVLLVSLRHAGNSQAATGAIVTPPPLSWPPGRRAAPEFALTDQRGRAVSVAAFHGRPVIVTFIDPLCRNLCPLEAQTLNSVVRALPSAQRPAIVAVSVDVWADARADLLQDERRWELVPQWYWAVGKPSALASVWRRYYIGVSVVTKRLGALAIHYITHTEAAYVIDATGHERALFVWPFYPQDVKRVLQQLS